MISPFTNAQMKALLRLIKSDETLLSIWWTRPNMKISTAHWFSLFLLCQVTQSQPWLFLVRDTDFYWKQLVILYFFFPVKRPQSCGWWGKWLADGSLMDRARSETGILYEGRVKVVNRARQLAQWKLEKLILRDRR